MLSQRRADAVVAYLTSKFAISAAQLQAVGRGQEKLLVTTPDQTNEPANRRVTVVNLGA
jgi:outer membrane protein OmpA-like peptidoglycan-associated protein